MHGADQQQQVSPFSASEMAAVFAVHPVTYHRVNGENTEWARWNKRAKNWRARA
jgi:hypothetical protein